eukprot:7671-Pelagococcus_subviridis.AAC.2
MSPDARADGSVCDRARPPPPFAAVSRDAFEDEDARGRVRRAFERVRGSRVAGVAMCARGPSTTPNGQFGSVEFEHAPTSHHGVPCEILIGELKGDSIKC